MLRNERPAPRRQADDIAAAGRRITPMWIAGEAAATRQLLPVVDPYRRDVIAHVPMAAVADIERAVERMTAGEPARLSRGERARILRRMAAILDQRRQDLAQLASRESGLALRDTEYEVSRAIDALELAADATSFDDAGVFPGDIGRNGKQRRIFSHREPIGLIAAITPFNHPLNQVVHKIAPAIAANAPIIVKPSEKTPLSALRLAEIAYEAGLPQQLLSVVTGDPQVVVETLIRHPSVALVSFTGSPAVGKRIASRIGYRRLVMELGGNDPLIVMPDADLSRAAALAVAGAFGNSGQRCTAVKRILVHRSVADRFVTQLAELAGGWRAGDPLDARSDIGTVIDEAAACEIEARAAEAVRLGARPVLPLRRDGALLTPSVYDDVPLAARLIVEETFGPVAPVIRFDSIEQAIAIANGTPFGLSAGVCTDRLDWITRFAAELKVGGLNVWDVPGYRSELSPFGGIKDSGLGQKEGILEAIKLCTVTKTVSVPWT